MAILKTLLPKAKTETSEKEATIPNDPCDEIPTGSSHVDTAVAVDALVLERIKHDAMARWESVVKDQEEKSLTRSSSHSTTSSTTSRARRKTKSPTRGSGSTSTSPRRTPRMPPKAKSLDNTAVGSTIDSATGTIRRTKTSASPRPPTSRKGKDSSTVKLPSSKSLVEKAGKIKPLRNSSHSPRRAKTNQEDTKRSRSAKRDTPKTRSPARLTSSSRPTVRRTTSETVGQSQRETTVSPPVLKCATSAYASGAAADRPGLPRNESRLRKSCLEATIEKEKSKCRIRRAISTDCHSTGATSTRSLHAAATTTSNGREERRKRPIPRTRSHNTQSAARRLRAASSVDP